jgi:hypothetical protein
MNWNIVFSLLRGSNIYETAAKLLGVVAGFLAAKDTDREGSDDLLAGCLLSLSDGISAYAVRDNNEHGNIVDGLIATLTRYREEMAACGKIT